MRPIAVGKVLRRRIAKCLASEAQSEAIELFDSLQLGVGISGGAEAVIHSSKITYDNIVSAQKDEELLQIDFQNAFNSVKRSHLLKATYDFIPGIAPFTNFATPSTHHSFVTMQSFKVNWVFSRVIRWDRYCSP